jgi:hypothetical protein
MINNRNMNVEEKVKINLLTRGFDNKTILNNRGLIGATIDETILEVVKNQRISESELLLSAICQFTKRNTQKEIQEVQKWIETYYRD